MGTMSKIQELRARRRAYQAQKTKEYKQRIAAYLSDADKRILFSGEGFIRVPEEEAKREKIDVYPYLFVKKVTEPWDGPQGFLLYKYLYSFKSPKSHQTYWV